MSLLQLDESQLHEFAKSVELTATRFLEGMHPSARGGEGIEFHSYQPYTEGEDARRIDWRRWAQSDRLFVRKFEKTEKLGWSILVDRSPSLQFAEKAKHAQLFCGVLCYLAKLWADSWMLVPSTHQDLQEAFKNLLAGQVGLEPSAFSQVQGNSKNRLVVVSDFFFETEEIEKAMEVWKAEFDSISLVQVLASEEMAFPYAEVTEFEDLESSKKLLLDGKAVQKAYLQELANLQKVLRSQVDDKVSFQILEARSNLIFNQLEEFFEKP